ncbi:DUF2382 domain-containing protein [Blastococcus sp. SYSU D00820]
MITEQSISSLIGSTAVGPEGKIGTVGEVYLDDSTGRPEWATVRTGLFGTKEAFVPLADADLAGGELRVPYDKKMVAGAPHHDVEGHLSPSEEADLYRYYGLDGGQSVAAAVGTVDGPPAAGTTSGITADTTRDTGTRGAVGHDTSGPTTDNAMTRSEERLAVGTQRVESGVARLRKYVVTENVTETVPVSREEVRVQREPITDANIGNALDGPAISEEEHEVTLHAERPVVAKEAVPVERVRLDTETVTDTETVNDTVRKEEIEVDTDGRTGPTGRA